MKLDLVTYLWTSITLFELGDMNKDISIKFFGIYEPKTSVINPANNYSFHNLPHFPYITFR
ncbi:hypothetical protein IFVP203_C1220016 [Vibrio parahaemolyticus]